MEFRSAVLQVARGIRFYAGFLEDTLGEVREVKGAVEAYVEEA